MYRGEFDIHWFRSKCVSYFPPNFALWIFFFSISVCTKRRNYARIGRQTWRQKSVEQHLAAQCFKAVRERFSPFLHWRNPFSPRFSMHETEELCTNRKTISMEFLNKSWVNNIKFEDIFEEFDFFFSWHLKIFKNVLAKKSSKCDIFGGIFSCKPM